MRGRGTTRPAWEVLFLQLFSFMLGFLEKGADQCDSMICEKQFVPSDDRFLYCSET